MYTIHSIVVLYLVTLSEICNGYEYFGSSTVSSLINGIKDVFYLKPNNDTQTNTTSEDANTNIVEIVTKHGYNTEEHTITTEEGYILTLHRIPSQNSTKNNSVVFLMHGILDTSNSWVLQGPNNALAYILADEGFDVWMGNARGNRYSSSHVTLDKNSAKFWKFSWEEIGVYDIPAMIDYVLNTTGKDDLYYVGHSQGTTSFFVMMSLKPEYNVKVKMMFALAPITWINHAKSPIIKLFTPVYGILGYLTSNINTYASSTDFFNKIPSIFCNFLPTGCGDILQWIIGNDYKYINSSLMPIIFKNIPSGSSTLQFIHYGQLYQSGRFCRFDFGPSENYIKYGQSAPPDYELTNVNVPVVLFYSSNDWLSDVTDVAQLFDKLPNVHDSYNVDRFNHFDYMYANVAKELVYSNIVKIIRQFDLNGDDL